MYAYVCACVRISVYIFTMVSLNVKREEYQSRICVPFATNKIRSNRKREFRTGLIRRV